MAPKYEKRCNYEESHWFRDILKSQELETLRFCLSQESSLFSGDSRLIAPFFPLFRALCAALAAAAEHRAHLLCRGQVQARPCLRYSWIFTGIWDKGKARNRN